MLFAGLATLSVATALYGLASTVPWLYIASGLHGASLSLVHVSSLGLLSAFPEHITESMAGIEVCMCIQSYRGGRLVCCGTDVMYACVAFFFAV